MLLIMSTLLIICAVTIPCCEIMYHIVICACWKCKSTSYSFRRSSCFFRFSKILPLL
ncbi:hypothetical protein KC19_9G051100 [Ceratodon purpureus]|uniref:Uncharacterized protein n=1 Tax=Ceratodon purpureus TaxID=3225 RepID=A0A8T0GUC7_CERPU|nr:hypothetical protein KC19_9G051100 [Ceratodon purpureus]